MNSILNSFDWIDLVSTDQDTLDTYIFCFLNLDVWILNRILPLLTELLHPVLTWLTTT